MMLVFQAVGVPAGILPVPARTFNEANGSMQLKQSERDPCK
jgi:hypothetical protein